ncbi:MAG TPA: MFS transporter [Polyangiaceae bacterium]|nr:MFS transporter [Polyangiaceae bacterium]
MGDGSGEGGGEAAGAGRRRALLPRAVFALGLTSFFTDVGSEMVFLAGLGAAPAFLGLLEGLADATASVLKLVSGRLSDRAPAKKPLVLLGYGVATLARPLVALAAQPWHVLAVRVSDRVVKGLRSSPRDALLAAVAPPGQAGRAFGLHRAMDHAGAVVGPLVASLLLGLGWPLRRVFWLTIVPGLLSLACVLVVREPEAPPAPPAPAAGAARARLPRAFGTYLAIVSIFCLGNSSDAFSLLRARDAGVPLAALPAHLSPAEARGRAFGAYNFLTGLGALPAGLLTGWLWQAFGPAVALGTGAALAAAASALLLAWSAGAPRVH